MHTEAGGGTGARDAPVLSFSLGRLGGLPCPLLGRRSTFSCHVTCHCEERVGCPRLALPPGRPVGDHCSPCLDAQGVAGHPGWGQCGPRVSPADGRDGRSRVSVDHCIPRVAILPEICACYIVVVTFSNSARIRDGCDCAVYQ